MGEERGRSWTGSQSEVNNRLNAIIVLFFGLMCIFGGYLLGHRSNIVKRTHEMYNLTVAAENLYQKARRVTPKAVYHNGADSITAKLLDMFHCSASECGTINNKQNLAGLVRHCIKSEVKKMLRIVGNATVYLESLK